MTRHLSEACQYCQSGEWFRAPMRDYPDAHTMSPAGTVWVRFTKRTDDPKLAWVERRLAERGIPSRRVGHSFHAPILEVPQDREVAAWALLAEPFDEADGPTVDDMPDDDPVFSDDGD